MSYPEHIQRVVAKIAAGEDLSYDEDIIYLTQVMGYSEDEAVKQLALQETIDYTPVRNRYNDGIPR